MEKRGLYYDLIENDEDRRLLAQEGLIFDVSQLIWEVMEQSETSRAELARRLGTSKSYITKLLRGYSNLTLRSLSDIFSALGREVVIKAAPPGCVNNVLLVSENWELIDADETGNTAEITTEDEVIEETLLRGVA
ncbi:MAG: helix-turn-helix domain-containing protein [Candidatus Coatesbacteria bacterium]|nr:helix-turn-helix domain-containing protein [Candidatus Coatesbacteria bacterium]